MGSLEHNELVEVISSSSYWDMYIGRFFVGLKSTSLGNHTEKSTTCEEIMHIKDKLGVCIRNYTHSISWDVLTTQAQPLNNIWS